MLEYWIGQDVDYDRLWDAYDQGKGYIDKYHSMSVHLIRIKFKQQPSDLPLFNFEAVFKTIKGYFHDLKSLCLSENEYMTAGPLFIYSVERGSGFWTFLGELRQLLLLGTTMADEKVIGQKIENMEKRIDFLQKHFGDAVQPDDFKMFMKARTPRQLEKAVQRLFEQGIESVEVSREPFLGDTKKVESTLVDIKGLLDSADQQ